MSDLEPDAEIPAQPNPRLRTQLRQALGAVAVLIGFTAIPFETGFGATLLDLQRIVSALGSYADSPGVENAAWLILVIAILALLATLFAISRAPAASASPPRTIETLVAFGGLAVIVVLIAVWAVLASELGAEAGDVVGSPSSWVILVGGLLMLAGRGPAGSPEYIVRPRRSEEQAPDAAPREPVDRFLDRGRLEEQAPDAAPREPTAHKGVRGTTGAGVLSERDAQAGAVLAVSIAAVLALFLIIGAFAERDFIPIVLALSPFAMLAATNSTLARRAAPHLPPSMRWPLGLGHELVRSAAVGICGIVAIAGLGIMWTALMWLAVAALSAAAYAYADFEQLASQFAGEVTITAGTREYRVRTVEAARALMLVAAIVAAIVFLVRDDIWWLG